ncbi:putative trafficking protein particle complex subunit 11 [Blattamonas nauphoetae]|uniref:Trafficking protein particle complex subunit 11 n=1 Tax=Blattamonas nauphoetae TaxID=2049346 RepID=A0ABQ9X438_9EUKA|nr:putative trafficking protein particle complex subunit 11 [Blattamonas nauphoetae]
MKIQWIVKHTKIVPSVLVFLVDGVESMAESALSTLEQTVTNSINQIKENYSIHISNRSCRIYCVLVQTHPLNDTEKTELVSIMKKACDREFFAVLYPKESNSSKDKLLYSISSAAKVYYNTAEKAYRLLYNQADKLPSPELRVRYTLKRAFYEECVSNYVSAKKLYIQAFNLLQLTNSQPIEYFALSENIQFRILSLTRLTYPPFSPLQPALQSTSFMTSVLELHAIHLKTVAKRYIDPKYNSHYQSFLSRQHLVIADILNESGMFGTTFEEQNWYFFFVSALALIRARTEINSILKKDPFRAAVQGLSEDSTKQILSSFLTPHYVGRQRINPHVIDVAIPDPFKSPENALVFCQLIVEKCSPWSVNIIDRLQQALAFQSSLHSNHQRIRLYLHSLVALEKNKMKQYDSCVIDMGLSHYAHIVDTETIIVRNVEFSDFPSSHQLNLNSATSTHHLFLEDLDAAPIHFPSPDCFEMVPITSKVIPDSDQRWDLVCVDLLIKRKIIAQKANDAKTMFGTSMLLLADNGLFSEQNINTFLKEIVSILSPDNTVNQANTWRNLCFDVPVHYPLFKFSAHFPDEVEAATENVPLFVEIESSVIVPLHFESILLVFSESSLNTLFTEHDFQLGSSETNEKCFVRLVSQNNEKPKKSTKDWKILNQKYTPRLPKSDGEDHSTPAKSVSPPSLTLSPDTTPENESSPPEVLQKTSSLFLQPHRPLDLLFSVNVSSLTGSNYIQLVDVILTFKSPTTNETTSSSLLSETQKSLSLSFRSLLGIQLNSEENASFESLPTLTPSLQSNTEAPASLHPDICLAKWKQRMSAVSPHSRPFLSIIPTPNCLSVRTTLSTPYTNQLVHVLVTVTNDSESEKVLDVQIGLNWVSDGLVDAWSAIHSEWPIKIRQVSAESLKLGDIDPKQNATFSLFLHSHVPVPGDLEISASYSSFSRGKKTTKSIETVDTRIAFIDPIFPSVRIYTPSGFVDPLPYQPHPKMKLVAFSFSDNPLQFPQTEWTPSEFLEFIQKSTESPRLFPSCPSAPIAFAPISSYQTRFRLFTKEDVLLWIGFTPPGDEAIQLHTAHLSFPTNPTRQLDTVLDVSVVKENEDNKQQYELNTTLKPNGWVSFFVRFRAKRPITLSELLRVTTTFTKDSTALPFSLSSTGLSDILALPGSFTFTLPETLFDESPFSFSPLSFEVADPSLSNHLSELTEQTPFRLTTTLTNTTPSPFHICAALSESSSFLTAGPISTIRTIQPKSSITFSFTLIPLAPGHVTLPQLVVIVGYPPHFTPHTTSSQPNPRTIPVSQPFHFPTFCSSSLAHTRPFHVPPSQTSKDLVSPSSSVSSIAPNCQKYARITSLQPLHHSLATATSNGQPLKENDIQALLPSSPISLLYTLVPAQPRTNLGILSTTQSLSFQPDVFTETHPLSPLVNDSPLIIPISQYPHVKSFFNNCPVGFVPAIFTSPLHRTFVLPSSS